MICGGKVCRYSSFIRLFLTVRRKDKLFDTNPTFSLKQKVQLSLSLYFFQSFFSLYSLQAWFFHPLSFSPTDKFNGKLVWGFTTSLAIDTLMKRKAEVLLQRIILPLGGFDIFLISLFETSVSALYRACVIISLPVFDNLRSWFNKRYSLSLRTRPHLYP